MDVQAVAGAAHAKSKQKTAEDKNQEFLQALKDLDTYLESQKKSEAQKRAEKEAEAERKAKLKRMAELQMRIAQLRSRVLMGAENAEGELALLKNQLFHLQVFG